MTDKTHWVPAMVTLDLGLNDVPRRGDRRKAFEDGVRADLAVTVGSTLGRIKCLTLADGGQPRQVSFQFGSPLMPGDRSANELKGLFVAQVMDSSSVLYKGIVTCHTERASTLRAMGEDFLAASAESAHEAASDVSAASQAAIEQARARRRAQNMLANPRPTNRAPTEATGGSARNALFAAADIAAKEHARLTSLSMGMKQYLKVMAFYLVTTMTRLVGRWVLHMEMGKALAREQALVSLNSEAGEQEHQLVDTVQVKENEIQVLNTSLAEAESVVKEQQAKLAENALVMLERTELQSELRSTASSGAEMVGDISGKLAELMMALNQQGVLFQNKLEGT